MSRARKMAERYGITSLGDPSKDPVTQTGEDSFAARSMSDEDMLTADLKAREIPVDINKNLTAAELDKLKRGIRARKV